MLSIYLNYIKRLQTIVSFPPSCVVNAKISWPMGTFHLDQMLLRDDCNYYL